MFHYTSMISPEVRMITSSLLRVFARRSFARENFTLRRQVAKLNNNKKLIIKDYHRYKEYFKTLAFLAALRENGTPIKDYGFLFAPLPCKLFHQISNYLSSLICLSIFYSGRRWFTREDNLPALTIRNTLQD